jgi:hypothetical protein
MPVNVQIQGLEKLFALMADLPKRVQKALLVEFRETAREIANNAKKQAPVDTRRLANSISEKPLSGEQFGYEDVVQNSYAAYMEFGTKGNTRVPAGLESYAAQFKGRSGATGDPLKALEEWVKRKGIAGRFSTKTRRRLGNTVSKEKENKRVAYLIWRKIMREGVKAKPFFFKQMAPAEAKLKQRIATIIQDITS